MEFIVILAFVIAIATASRIRRAIGSTRGFQTPGEVRVSTLLMERFPPPDYHLLNHLTLRSGADTTQVDHVLVSRFGVFVIEAKDYSGWVFGSEGDRRWAHVIFGYRFGFQNPIHQNYKHVCVVRELLDFLPPEAIKSVVVFTGKAEFKTRLPEGVVRLQDLVAFLARDTKEVMSINRLQFCVGRLETMRLAVTRETDIQHVERLRRRHGLD